MNEQNTEFFVIPSSHLDFYWLGTREEMFSRGNKIISMALDVARKEGKFRFFIECMGFVCDYLRNHPAKRREIEKLVREGRIELIAQWAGIPQSDCSGEELMRNILYARDLIQTLFNSTPVTTSIIDIGSATPQFPQIVRKAGVRYLITGRARPEGSPLYYWEAPDGSRVLTWSPEESAPNAVTLGVDIDVETMKKRMANEKIEFSQHSYPIAAIYTVDLLLPPRNLCKNVEEWNKQSELKMEIATPQEYFRKVEEEKEIPKISGEMPQVYRGKGAFQTIPARSFTVDAKIRSSLLTAEKFCTISHILGYMEDQSSKIKDAWIHLLNAHSHGSDATGGEESDRRKVEDRRIAELCAEELTRDSLRTIAENVESPKDKCIPIVVFNPLSWARTDIVSAHATIYGNGSPFRMTEWICRLKGQEYQPIEEDYLLKDSEGNNVDIQIIEIKDVTAREIYFVFLAEEVPPIGYKTYYLWPVKRTRKNEQYVCNIEDEGKRIETNNFALIVHKKKGTLSIFEKKRERVIVDTLGVVRQKEIFREEKIPYISLGEREHIAPLEMEVLENGPVRARIAISGKKNDVRARQEITLYKELSRIDFNVEISWEKREKTDTFSASSRTLLDIPVQVDKPSIVYGVPYGYNELENVAPRSGPSKKDIWQTDRETWRKYREIQQWIDVSNKEYGVTVATNLVGVRVDPAIAICLVRSPETCKARFSIRPHGRGWKEAKAYRSGWETNNPLLSITVNDTYTPKCLPPMKSFCRVAAENVVVTTLEKGKNPKEVISRLYEAEGRRTETSIEFLGKARKMAVIDPLGEEERYQETENFRIERQEIKMLKTWL